MRLFSSFVVEHYWKKGIWTLDLGYTKRRADTSSLLQKVSNCRIKGAQVYDFDTCQKIAFFDGNHYYSLKMYSEVPTLEIDGLRMHLTRGWKNPMEYAKSVAQLVLARIGKKNPRVLDTCAGLGYISIQLSNMGAEVVSVEISRAVLEMAKINPFSKGLFKATKLLEGDVFELIEKLGAFDAIVHDPPRFSHSPLLYSRSFYKKCFDALNKGGILYHYVGSFGSSRGIDPAGSASKRLEEVGFKVLKMLKRHQAVLAEKPL